MVTGGRDYDNWERVCMVLGSLGITELAHGGARGADRQAGRWAEMAGVPCRVFYADWNTHGKRAGFIRNREMYDQFAPDGVVAFPGGNGTADMVRYARSKGARILTVAL